LIYIKPTLTGDEDADLQGYAAAHEDFPHSPTLNQFYDEDRFESYRQLGEHIGYRLCAELRGNAAELRWVFTDQGEQIDQRIALLQVNQQRALEVHADKMQTDPVGEAAFARPGASR
jgi:hypothetical protein